MLEYNNYEKISIFNTWINSENLGDSIIMNSCYRIIYTLFPRSNIIEVPTHAKLNFRSYRLCAKSSINLVCGTNLIKSNMYIKRLWDIDLKTAFLLKNVILLGVGWQAYSGKANYYSRFLLKRILSSDYIHAVRDNYTVIKLKEMGITNVINTGCPTLWDITDELCKQIPRIKANSVILTITSYTKNFLNDNQLIHILENNYEELYFWAQSYEDLEYFDSLEKTQEFNIVPPQIKYFDELLDRNIDYIGTRLHAGIRAIQKGKRTIIIGIDNRAIEMKPLGLNVVDRNDLDCLEEKIKSSFATSINIPVENIRIWKSQFNSNRDCTQIPRMMKLYFKIHKIYVHLRNKVMV